MVSRSKQPPPHQTAKPPPTKRSGSRGRAVDAAVGRAKKEPDQTAYSGRLAANLARLRERKGVAVEQMVEAIGRRGYRVAPATYYQWESGDRGIPADAYPAIAGALGVAIATLLPRE